MSNQLTLEGFFTELSKAIRKLRAYPRRSDGIGKKLLWFGVPGDTACYCPISLVRRHLGEEKTAMNGAATRWNRLGDYDRAAIVNAADNNRASIDRLGSFDFLSGYARKRLRDLRRRASRFAPQA